MNVGRKICVALLVIFDVACIQSYVAPNDIFLKYISQDQKNQLFESVGCQYCNHIKIHASNFDAIDVTKLFDKNDSSKIQDFEQYLLINQAIVQKYGHQIVNYDLISCYVQWISEEVGYGLFAQEDIHIFDFIGVYTGELSVLQDSSNLTMQDIAYAWLYPVMTPDQKYLSLDAKYFGNELRFVNHDQNPNTECLEVLINGLFYTCYFAVQDIAKGGQITVSYGDNYWYARQKNPEKLY